MIPRFPTIKAASGRRGILLSLIHDLRLDNARKLVIFA